MWMKMKMNMHARPQKGKEKLVHYKEPRCIIHVRTQNTSMHALYIYRQCIIYNPILPYLSII